MTQFSKETTHAGNGRRRSDICPGICVEIVLKQDQRSGKRTRGIVREILTNSQTHPHGIKVRLTSGHIGRVASIIDSNASDISRSHE